MRNRHLIVARTSQGRLLSCDVLGLLLRQQDILASALQIPQLMVCRQSLADRPLAIDTSHAIPEERQEIRNFLAAADRPPVLLVAATAAEAASYASLFTPSDDSFIARPNAPGELVARLGRIGCNTQSPVTPHSPNKLPRPMYFSEVHDVVYDDAGAQVQLTTAEARLLAFFIRAKASFVTRPAARQYVTDRPSQEQEQDRYIDVLVNRLRAKLKVFSNFPVIVSVRKEGYLLATPVILTRERASHAAAPSMLQGPSHAAHRAYDAKVPGTAPAPGTGMSFA